MTSDQYERAVVHEQDGEWTFACDECPEVRTAETENEALDHAKNHCEYGPGHFSFTISDPDGVIQYGK